MNELTTFENEQFGTVRGLLIDGDPWFVAADICRALGIGNPTMALIRLDDDEKNTLNIIEGTPGNPNVNIISEAGMYKLMSTSRKPEARAFTRWVTHEVLPTIRATGGYVANDDMFINTYLPFADEQTRTLFKCTLQTINKQNRMIAEMQPKANFADSVTGSEDGVLIGTLAKFLKQKGVKTGQNRLFAWMRKNDYLMKNGQRKNLPTQAAMEQGLFQIRESVVEDADGNTHTHMTPLVTGKGQVYFINKFLGNEAVNELA